VDLKRWQRNPQRAYSAAGKSSGPVLVCFLTWSIIIILAVVTVRVVRPPAPEPATAPDHEFSAERATKRVCS
jgi:hypothetical protein